MNETHAAVNEQNASEKIFSIAAILNDIKSTFP